MSEQETNAGLARRQLLAAGGLGAVAAALMAGSASAGEKHEQTAGEKANIDLVNRFTGSFFDPTKVEYDLIHPEGRIRVGEMVPIAVGPAAAKAQFFSFLKPSDRTVVVTHWTWAKGPMVINYRTDTVKTEGKPDTDWPLVGVFFIQDGKIKEWCDFPAV